MTARFFNDDETVGDCNNLFLGYQTECSLKFEADKSRFGASDLHNFKLRTRLDDESGLFVGAGACLVNEDLVSTCRELCKVVILDYAENTIVVNRQDVDLWFTRGVFSCDDDVHWLVKFDVVSDLHNGVNFGELEASQAEA